MADPVKSSLNQALTAALVIIGIITLTAILFLNLPFLNLPIQDRVLMINLVLGLMVPIATVLGSILIRDMHHAMNSTLEKVTESTSREFLLRGRAEMQEEMQQEMKKMREEIYTSARNAAKQLITDATEMNRITKEELVKTAQAVVELAAIQNAQKVEELAAAARVLVQDAKETAVVMQRTAADVAVDIMSKEQK